jgi:hypothetical protein
MSRGLIHEGQARRLTGGNVPLLAPGCEGTKTNPDLGDTETGFLKLCRSTSSARLSQASKVAGNMFESLNNFNRAG